MSNSIFTGGVAPGGLKSQSEIRLLICYLLSSVDQPLSKNDIVMVLQDHGLANYFEAASALADVLNKKNADTLPEDEELCVANEMTHAISAQLETILQPSVRDRAVKGALQLLSMAKLERENQVEIAKDGDAFTVTCHISGGEHDLLRFTLRVPDQFQARAVKKTFHRNPALVYQVMMCLLTDNKNYIETLLKES